jgi:hypothetical protein
MHPKTLALAQSPGQDGLEVSDGGIEVEDLRLKNLAPAEGEELLGDPRGPLRCAPDLVHVLADGFYQIGALEHVVGAAQDYRHHVIRFVRNAPRKLADRVHALRLPKPLLQQLAVGHVQTDAGHVSDRPVGIENYLTLICHPPLLTARLQNSELHIKLVLTGESALEGALDVTTVIFVDSVQHI